MPAPPSARRLQDGSKTGPRRSFRLFPLLILQLSEPDPQGLDALLDATLLAAYSLCCVTVCLQSGGVHSSACRAQSPAC